MLKSAAAIAVAAGTWTAIYSEVNGINGLITYLANTMQERELFSLSKKATT